MKLLQSGFIILSAVVLLSGCASTDDKAKKKPEKIKLTPMQYLEGIKPDLAKISPKEEPKVRKFAAFHEENFYKALKNNDYKSFVKSKKLSKSDFKKWRAGVTRAYGELQSKSFIGVDAKPMIMRYMWKWNFKKKAMGTTLNREILYNVFVIKYKNKDHYDLFFVGPE